MNYEFNGRDDLLLQKGRSNRKNRSGKQTNSCDSSIDTENNDVNSLTYSASSSQAGESTDSSIADFTYLLEQQQHMLQQQNAQRSKHHHIHQRPRSGSGQFARENSLGYSDDTDYDDDQGPGQPSSSSEKSSSLLHLMENHASSECIEQVEAAHLRRTMANISNLE